MDRREVFYAGAVLCSVSLAYIVHTHMCEGGINLEASGRAIMKGFARQRDYQDTGFVALGGAGLLALCVPEFFALRKRND